MAEGFCVFFIALLLGNVYVGHDGLRDEEKAAKPRRGS
jgi:hypothetical protein